MLRISAWLGIVFGIAVGAVQLWRNYDNWEKWPTWVSDELGAAMLILGGLQALRRGTGRLLTAAWGVECGMLWLVFFGNVWAHRYFEHLQTQDHMILTAFSGCAFVTALIGLALILFDPAARRGAAA